MIDESENGDGNETPQLGAQRDSLAKQETEISQMNHGNKAKQSKSGSELAKPKPQFFLYTKLN